MIAAEKRERLSMKYHLRARRGFRVPALIALCACLSGLAAAWPGGAPRAERELVDRVVAVVEDEAIFQTDIDQAVSQYMIEQGRTSLPDSARRTLEKQILDSMVGDKLIVAQAKELGIEVSFEEVEENVEQTIAEKQEQLGGEEAFQKQLELEHLSIEELKRLYRDQIRTRMLVDKVIAGEIDRSKLAVSDEELRKSYEQNKALLPSRPEVVHLQTIFFSFDSSKDASEAARKKAEEIYEQIRDGADFADMAEKYSEDPSAALGGDLGFIQLGDLRDRAFAEAAAKLKPGEVGPPVRTSLGYHIIKVEAINPDNGEVRLRHILVRVKPGEGDKREVFDRAAQIRDRILAGESFDSLAAKYSDDQATADSGGDLGWLKLADLPQFFQDILQGMKPGDVSQVLQESSGFRIVKLLEREAGRSYTFEEVQTQLRRNLEQEKLAAVYEEYIQGLHKKFYVKLIGSN